MAFKVLSELLNDSSLSAAHKTMEIEYIPREMIVKNERNHYHIKNVADLAQDIKMGGLEQPIVVMETEDGTYKLLSGERRLTGIDFLMEQEEWTGDIPCIVKDLEEYDLPLPDDLKEDYAIMRTNGFTRVLNDSDILYQSEKWEKIIEEHRKAGYEGIINWMNDKFHVVTVFMKFVPIQQIMLYLLPLALLVGIVIGLLGSSITIRKYLKV